MNSFSIASRLGILTAVTPFLAMLFQAGNQWLAAYSEQQTPQLALNKSIVMAEPTETEKITFARTIIKQEAVEDYLNNLASLEETLEKFNSLNLGMTHFNMAFEPIFPWAQNLDPNLVQLLTYAKIKLKPGEQQHFRKTLLDVECESIALVESRKFPLH